MVKTLKGRKAETALPLVPPRPTLRNLREAALTCRACPLWKTATQTVFGKGPMKAKVMLVGEQPGFEEDRIGEPFVGPAGKLLEKALAQAGIERADVYLTNVVKHFKWEPKGQLHMHKKPNAREIAACRPWLDAELGLVKPDILVCLGATAAQALLGRDFRVSRQRGDWIESPIPARVLATVHPSSILRAPDDETRHAQMAAFVADLKKVAAAMRALK
jgi:DNA polymerase